MKHTKEIRYFDASVEQREDGQPGKISGYAAVFNKDSEDMGFIERIAPGAFKDALKKADVVALRNHDANIVIGRTGVNLRLKEDKKGLHMELDPIDTPNYRAVEADIKAGLVSKQSFGFTVEEDSWEGLDTQTPRRTIQKIKDLFDVSIVTFPAYPDTSVALRSLDDAKRAATGAENGETARINRNLQLIAEASAL